jgi:hypothetical protein
MLQPYGKSDGFYAAANLNPPLTAPGVIFGLVVLKPTLLISPVIALAIAGTWIGSQRHALVILDQQCAALRTAIAA